MNIDFIKNIFVVPAIILLVNSSPLVGEEPTKESLNFSILSKTNEQEYEIYISLPESFHKEQQRYPVIYTTDGEAPFQLVQAFAKRHYSHGLIPEVIVVGIGYLTDGDSLRNRDFTPTYYADFPLFTEDLPDSFKLHDGISTGGAEDFYRFIEEELKPAINSRYRTLPEDETLLGYSLGGLFGVYTLFNHTDSFARYIIGSPSLWYDDKISFVYEQLYSEKYADMSKSVFISVGSLEEQNASDPSKMVSNATDFYSNLSQRKYPGLSLVFSILDGKTHGNALFKTIDLGIKSVFEIIQSATICTRKRDIC